MGSPRLFTSPRDVEAARPSLDRECGISLQEFAGLVGPYSFPEADRVSCQLDEKGDGSLCRQVHGRGWVVRRKDGKEGLIGRDCAKGHFGADANFSSEVQRVNRELRIDSLVARILERQSDESFADRLDAAINRQRELRDQITKLRDCWPEELLRRLADMGKSGNSSVMVSVRYVEKDEGGRPKYTYQPVRIGSISTPGAMDRSALSAIATRLQDAQAALHEAIPDRQQKERKLREWIQAIDGLEQCEGELDEIPEGLAQFTAPENLKLLCWTVRPDHIQDAILRAALELMTGQSVSEEEARREKLALAGEIRKANGSRDFFALG